MKPLDLRVATVGVLACALVACDCGPLGVDQRRFACSTNDDCAEGFVCVNRGSGLECVSRDAPLGGGSAAGGSTAGGMGGGGAAGGGVAGGDAGGAAGGDAGGAAGGDAGGAAGGDAGGTAGGDAGGSAGGAVAGGSAGGTAGGRAGGAAGGAAGGGSAGGTAGGSAGGGSAGGSAGGAVGPATQLAFSTPPRSTPIATCSLVITLETRDASGRFSPVTMGTSVSLGVAGSVTLHTSAACTSPAVSSINLTPGNPTANLYARGTTPAVFTLAAGAAGLTATTQAVTFTDGPDTIVFTNTPPTPLRAGACFPLSYQTRRLGVAMPVASNTTVTLSSAPAGIARFYSDAACTALLSTQVLAAGTSTDNVFVRVVTGSTPGTLQASAALFTPATVAVNALPMVRRGTCTFPAQVFTLIDGGVDAGLIDGGPTETLFQNCGISPLPLSNAATMLFLQATTPSQYSDGEIRCRLGTTSGDSLRCVRRSGVGTATVQWQVVEIPSGVRVVTALSTGCPAQVTLSSAVDPTKTFLLKTLANGMGNFDDEDVTTFSLASPTTVTLSRTTCEGFDLQAVEWDGVTVTRGELDGGFLPGVTNASVLGLPPASLQRALLTQSGTLVSMPTPTCGLLVRGALPGPSEVRLSRAFGDGGCAPVALPRVEFERLDFGTRATVQERTVTLGAGVTDLPTTITSVDPTRTFVFASNQSGFGQGMGESSWPAASPGAPQDATFILELTNPTTVTARRAQAGSATLLTFYVVQVE